MDRQRLINAAIELNEVLGCDPQISYNNVDSVLLALLKEAGSLIEPETDRFTAATIDLLREIDAFPDEGQHNNQYPEGGCVQEGVEIESDPQDEINS